MQSTALVGIDWGTSNLRVFRIGGDGAVLDCHRGNDGLMSIVDGGFALHLAGVLARWPDLDSHIPLIACGMVGARQGWVEAPYVACPARLGVLGEQLARAPLPDGRTVHIVPGLSVEAVDGTLDVMRGEETAINGASEGVSGIYCLPGTHAKWAHLADGAVVSFRTAMTGELYQLLANHSILARMLSADSPFDHSAFLAGVSHSGADGGLLHQLFSVRTSRLFDRITHDAAASYLSGILVGSDVRAATASLDGGAVTVLGDGHLADAYVLALDAFGIAHRTVPGEKAVVAGLVRAATAAGLEGAPAS